MALGHKERVTCMGGCSFLCTALGLFTLVPGCVIFAVFGMDSTHTTEQIAAIVVFAIGMSMFLGGMVTCIVWCRKDKYGTRWEGMSPEQINAEKQKLAANNGQGVC